MDGAALSEILKKLTNLFCGLTILKQRIKGAVSQTAHAQLISQKFPDLVRRFQVCDL